MPSRRVISHARSSAWLGVVVAAACLISLAARPVDQTGAGATIAGVVAGANGVGWPGMAVRVRRLGRGAPVTLTADANGGFRLEVEPGVYRVVLGARRGVRPHVRNEVAVAPGAVVRVEGRVRAASQFEYGGGQVTGPGDGDLRVRVTDLAGHVLAAAGISVPGTPLSEPRLTDASGQFRTVLPEGRYSLRVEVPGFETRTVFPVAITAGSETHADVTLEPAARYRGGSSW